MPSSAITLKRDASFSKPNDNGKPKLVVADFWGAFSDFGRQDEDQDLGAAGVFIIPGNYTFVEGLGRRKKTEHVPVATEARTEGAH